MATTESTAAYHYPHLKKYIRYVYPDFSEEQYAAIDEVAKAGGIEMCVIHELAVCKHLGAERKSGQGYDFICKKSPYKFEVEYKRPGKYEAKYRRLVNNKNKGGEYWLMKLGTKELRAKTADFLWITVYNQFIEDEDHFMVPMSDITGKSFNFTYNIQYDNYNQGQQYHVHRGFLE